MKSPTSASDNAWHELRALARQLEEPLKVDYCGDLRVLLNGSIFFINHEKPFGAGDENRTRVLSLGS